MYIMKILNFFLLQIFEANQKHRAVVMDVQERLESYEKFVLYFFRFYYKKDFAKSK